MNPESPRAGARAETPVERLSLLISLIVVGLTISLVLNLPSRLVRFSLLGSEATIVFSGAWLFAILLATLTAAGVDSIVRAHSRVHLVRTRYTAILWVLPCLLVAIAALVIPSFAGSGLAGLVLVLSTGVLLHLVILAEYRTLDLDDPAYAFARLALNLAAYVLALVLFGAVYSIKLRSVLSAPVIGLASGLLALELVRGSESDVRRTWLYGAAIGLAMGELLWGVNYSNLTGLQAAVFLTLVFYILTASAQQYLWGYLSRWMLVEFAAVTLTVFWLLLRFGSPAGVY